MAITVYANTGTEQDLKDAAIAAGFEPDEKAAPEDKAGTKTEQDKPGDKSAAEKPVKAAPDSGPEDKSQLGETQEEEEEKRKSKGGFQRKLEKLTAQLDEERGDKADLKRQIRDLQSKIEELQTTAAPPVVETVEKGPVKPKRPKPVGSLESFEWDQVKYDAAVAAHETAMDKYETDLEEFHRKVAAESASAEIQKRETAAAEVRRNEEFVKMQHAYVDRLNEGRAVIEDYQDMLDAVPENTSTIFDANEKDAQGQPVASHAYVFIMNKAKNPADLIYHFAKDIVEGDGADNKRFQDMDPVDLISELSWMDRQLTQQKAAAKQGGEKAKPAAEAEPEKKKTPPVAERQTPPPVRATPAPRERLGAGGTPAVAGNLDEQMREAAAANDGPRFRKLLEQQQKQNAARRGA